MVSVKLCYIYIYIYVYSNLNREGITHLDVVKMIVVEELNCRINNGGC